MACETLEFEWLSFELFREINKNDAVLLADNQPFKDLIKILLVLANDGLNPTVNEFPYK